MSERKPSRRDFIKIGGVTSLATFLTLSGVAAYLTEEELNWGSCDLSFMEGLKLPEKKLNEDLRGGGVNSPDLIYLPTKDIQDTLNIPWAKTIRCFLHNFETTLGSYDEIELQRIDSVLELLPEGKKLIISLIDFYGILYSDTFGQELYSPYYREAQMRTKLENQLAIFNDERVFNYFLQHTAKVVERYKDCDNVIFEIANEPKIIGNNNESESREILTLWYKTVIEFIRDLGYKSTLTTGLMHPWLIDESKMSDLVNVVNTDHSYFKPVEGAKHLIQLTEFLPSSKLPLMISEIGVHDYFGGSHALPFFITAVLNATIKDGVLYAQTVMPWKYKGHQDGFKIKEADETFTFMTQLEEVYESLKLKQE